MNVRSHKHFLTFFFFILTSCSLFLTRYFDCLGFKFIVNGKFGVGGSIKTKTIIFKKGINSLNSKNLRLEFQKIQIKTKSGALGLKYYLFY